MKKAKAVAVLLGTGILCTVGFVAGSYTKEHLIEEAAQEARKQAEESKPGYILIHTTDGEVWGFCGDMKIISDGTGGGEIDIDMTGWLVGSTHDCYNPE